MTPLEMPPIRARCRRRAWRRPFYLHASALVAALALVLQVLNMTLTTAIIITTVGMMVITEITTAEEATAAAAAVAVAAAIIAVPPGGLTVIIPTDMIR